MMATRRTERRSSVYSMATDDSIGPMTRTRAGSQPKRKFFAEGTRHVPGPEQQPELERKTVHGLTCGDGTQR